MSAIIAPMSKETIAIDVDDVLADHAAAFTEFSNQNYGTNITQHEYTEQWGKLWQIDDWEEVERRATEFHTTNSVADYLLIDGAQAALRQLADYYNLTIVTARRQTSIEATYNWLEQHFEDVFTEVHFVPIWQPGNTVTKADICNQIAADYLIDDLGKHCNVAAQAGVTALLFGDYNWNRGDELDPSVIRVRDWASVTRYFDGRN